MKRRIGIGATIIAGAIGGVWVTIPEPLDHVCCGRWIDNTPEGMYECRVDGYIGFFVETSDDCINNMMVENRPVAVRVVNRIWRGIGDSNYDSFVDLIDWAAFEKCFGQPDAYPWNCLCPFDYDYDGDVDFQDFADWQVAFGSSK